MDTHPNQIQAAVEEMTQLMIWILVQDPNGLYKIQAAIEIVKETGLELVYAGQLEELARQTMEEIGSVIDE